MRRFLAMAAIFLIADGVRADAFDDYTNVHLAKLIASKNVEKVDKIAQEDLVAATEVLPGIRSAFIVVRNNDGRLTKMLVQAARQKAPKGETVDIFLIDRYVTFRDGDEKTVIAQAQNVRLFHDFRFNTDIGQVVPPAFPADLRFVAEGDKVHIETVGKAEMYLVTKHLAEAAPVKGAKVVAGAAFAPTHFNGVYKLYDDGRRSGELHLKIGDKGGISGAYYSDKDGAKYEVEGQVGPNPPSGIQFRIAFPRTAQFYTGWMFTGDARAITGFANLQGVETGFYAIRKEE